MSDLRSSSAAQESVERVRGEATAFSDYAFITGARLASISLSVVSVFLTTHLIAPSGYASLAYLLVLATLIFAVSAQWTSVAAVRYGREQFDATGSLQVTNWTRLALATPLFAAGAAVVLGLKLVGALPPEMSWEMTVLAISYAAALVVVEHLAALLEAGGRLKAAAVGRLVSHLLVVAGLTGFFLVVSDPSAGDIASLTVVASAVVALGLAISMRTLIGLRPIVSVALLRRISTFSAPLILFTLSQYVAASVDIIVIREFRTAEDTGLYALAYQAYAVLQQLPAVSTTVFVPLLVSAVAVEGAGVLRAYVERVVPLLTFLASVVVGLVIPLVPHAVPIVFGRPFEDSAEPLVILLGAFVSLYAASLVAPILLVRELTKPVALISVVATSANVALDVLLIGALGAGIWAAALATGISVATVAFAYGYIAGRAVGARSPTRLVLFAPALLSLAIVLVDSGLYGTVLALLAAMLSAAAVYALVQPLRREDLRWIDRSDVPGWARRTLLALARPNRKPNS